MDRKIGIFIAIFVLTLVSCSKENNSSANDEDKIKDQKTEQAIFDTDTTTPEVKPYTEPVMPVEVKPAKREVYTEVEINSLDELYTLFKAHHYTNEAWQQGHRNVPRFIFKKVSAKWQNSSAEMPVKVKKDVFFRLMAPLVLMVNEEIMQQRAFVEQQAVNSDAVKALMIKYRVITSSFQETLTSSHKNELLKRLDIIPPSLALAQAAEESGWATSRFTLEGNAFFGQWDYSGKGMVPKSQRKELGNYGIARFDTPLDSVRGYALNINSGHAYEKLRTLRLSLRTKDQMITGLTLATTLDKYSERGQAYIDSIQSMIRYNRLMVIDEAVLESGENILLISAAVRH